MYYERKSCVLFARTENSSLHERSALLKLIHSFLALNAKIHFVSKVNKVDISYSEKILYQFTSEWHDLYLFNVAKRLFDNDRTESSNGCHSGIILSLKRT